MRHAAFALALLVATPLAAQDTADPPSLMERGAQMFLEGLLEETAPAMDEMATLLEDMGPAVQDFLREMGPKLKSVMADVEDWSVYEAPEVLPNGDIIIRRKPDAPLPDPEPLPPLPDGPQIEL
ncbi:hypothetical protein [Sulfitobacter sp. S190]|uniref:hypothetical protein n=1 Tax=Sulfitobacter sp. S190 TaxID=2867022 RepID=UPI0021A635AC|nr:hypothetical protein [Sulfitobacter sp. S190]UWR24209.1 hypothetical protein K3756_12490 [Sulfitobacter sp. S190]